MISLLTDHHARSVPSRLTTIAMAILMILPTLSQALSPVFLRALNTRGATNLLVGSCVDVHPLSTHEQCS
jgi:hypothetical protein